MNFFDERLRHKGKLLIPFLTILIVGLPLFFIKFGRLDDFTFYLYAKSDFAGLAASGFTFGRPINSSLNALDFSVMHNIARFSWLRFLNVLLLVASLELYLFVHKKVTKWDSIQKRICIYFLIFSLPGIWVFLTWAQGVPHFLALLVAVLSSYFLVVKENRFAFLICLSLSIFTYQPLGLLVPALCFSLIGKKQGQKTIDLVKFSTLSTIAITTVNFISIHLSKHPNSRSTIVSDYSGKTKWIIHEWIPRVFFPYPLHASLLPAVIAITLFLLVLILVGRSYNFSKSLYGAMVILLPSLPFLAINENWASSRAILSTNIAILCVMFYSYRTLDNRKIRSNLGIACFGLSFFLFSLSAVFALKGLVAPQSKEWNSTLRIVSNLPNEVKSLKLQLTNFEQTSSSVLSYDEYGVQNTSVGEVGVAQTLLAIDQLHIKNLSVTLQNKRICSTNRMNLKNGILVISPLAGLISCK